MCFWGHRISATGPGGRTDVCPGAVSPGARRQPARCRPRRARLVSLTRAGSALSRRGVPHHKLEIGSDLRSYAASSGGGLSCSAPKGTWPDNRPGSAFRQIVRAGGRWYTWGRVRQGRGLADDAAAAPHAGAVADSLTRCGCSHHAGADADSLTMRLQPPRWCGAIPRRRGASRPGSSELPGGTVERPSGHRWPAAPRRRSRRSPR